MHWTHLNRSIIDSDGCCGTPRDGGGGCLCFQSGEDREEPGWKPVEE